MNKYRDYEKILNAVIESIEKNRVQLAMEYGVDIAQIVDHLKKAIDMLDA